ncbi:hypothetical protein TanjilG_26878 [Lupinus angustifolius]|uniref:DUF4408 domain-containing protein n=1 Tax=Lupinus angustifolius TaxID=3871 RepID=A0A4P1RJ29_LUPAN|nr:PREDICTED: uncharacterized protein LOC109348174 [Lupinus angustifolius]XP_019443988.1 PREDICTED: uncharacterized protein LOC109348174 [Lupinus angustifolius]OIW11512.1 hypothetical protein TanjilG_26878 [Lupinus angustifolius]
MGFLNMKTILISTGILSMAMGLKLSFPIITHFIISELVPSISSFFYTSLTPPYLYILLNFIILTILASSKFHTEPVLYTTTVQPEPVKITQIDYNNNVYNGVVSDAPFYNSETTPLSIDTVVNVNGNDRYVYDVDLPEETTVNNVVSGSEAYQPETAPLRDDAVMNSDGYLYDGHAPVETTVASGNDAVATPYLHKKEPLKFSNDENEKPPFSARFSQRKAVRTTPEGGKVVALGVAKSKKQDTLESTWKTITEGRAMPLTRHLKKSETWEQQNRRNATPFTDLNGGDGGGGKAVMKKSETFSGRENKNTVSSSPGSGGKLRKESSLSQDELHRRVEAFIKKFNTEMRLQRQESLRQYSNMIDSGAQ